MAADPVLVIGATGNLGGRVVRELTSSGAAVRATARAGTDASGLRAQGVEVVPADLLDPVSLRRALDGARAVVTTAIGYLGRRAGDTLQSVDDVGNRNLVEAVREVGTPVTVFTSILAADQAADVPHFHQKHVIEACLADSGVPYVALRPGAFLGSPDLWSSGLRRGRLMTVGRRGTAWTYVHPADVARIAAAAVDEPGALYGHVDIGTDRDLDAWQLAQAFGRLLGRDVRVLAPPVGLLDAALTAGGVVRPDLKDFRNMFRFFLSGRYRADTSRQAELFGPPPTVEESLARYLADVSLLPGR